MDIDFDVMTNQEIQKRLVEYGMPSVPVTQTTRKVLIKKLKLASEKEKQKTRRDTIAITKFSSDEEKESESDRKKHEKTPNRRATIAPGEKVSKSATSSTNGAGKDVTEMPAPRSTRRSTSGRLTPSEKPAIVTSSVPVVPAILEDTDEEVKETLKTAPKRFSKSKSKTPTLSKTDTVRISYKAEQEKVIREEDDDVMIVDDDDDEPEQVAPVSKIPEPKFVSKTETVNRRKTITTSGTPNTMTSSIPTFSTRYSSVGDSKYDRPALGTSYRSYTSTSTSYRPTEKYQDDDEDEDDDEENIDANAPYLSNFAKRLSTLRAEPLDAGLDLYKKKLRENVEYPNYRSSTSGYNYKRDVVAPANKDNKPTLTRSFINVLEALDRQYHIRKKLYILFVIIILVALYVIFIKY